MKKFKFSLEKVLMQRQIAVDLAKKSFLEAQEAKNVAVEELNEMVNTKKRSLEERSTMIQNSSDWVNFVAQINSFVIGQDLRIKKQNLRLQEAENLVESRREFLRERVSEVKILERLAEKQKQAFMKQVAKAEQNELDELSVLRFSRIESLTKGSHEDGI